MYKSDVKKLEIRSFRSVSDVREMERRDYMI